MRLRLSIRLRFTRSQREITKLLFNFIFTKTSLTHFFTNLFLLSIHISMSFSFRYSVQEKIIRNRNDDDRYSIRSSNKLNANEFYDPNQNKYYKMNNINNGHHIITNGNVNNINGNGNIGTSVLRERYQHPALVAIINEAQGIKFRGEFQSCSFCHW